MKPEEEDFIATIPQPLLDWIKSQRTLPPSLLKSRTFYAASRAALALQWTRKLRRFMALRNWAILSLIADKRTRAYMAKLIDDDVEGFSWTDHFGRATRVAMEELTGIDASLTGHLFKQRRDAALAELRKARENLAAIDADFGLCDLLVEPFDSKFREAVDQFMYSRNTRRSVEVARVRAKTVKSGASVLECAVASLEEMARIKQDRVPKLSDIMLAAETAISNIAEPRVDRHGARSRYLREMFKGLKFTVVSSWRIAFLAHSSEVVFGEHMEKREVRRLVSDLVNDERKYAAELVAEKEEYRKAGGKIPDWDDA